MRVLVTGANGDVADAACRALSGAGDLEVEGCDASGPLPAAAFLPAVHELPRADDPGYLLALGALVGERAIDLVVPCTEPELARLATGAVADVALLMLDGSVVTTFLDKLTTARWLDEHGLPVAATTLLADATPDQLPLVVKPRTGSGSRGVTVVTTPARLAVERAERPDAIAQALLPDEHNELTCVVLRLGGTVRTLQLRRRLAGGMTIAAEVVDDPAVGRLLHDLGEAIGHEGSLNVQLRLTEQGPRIFEINPRLSSTLKLRHDAGFCDLTWWIAHHRSQPLPPFVPVPVGTRLYRLSRELVVRP